MGTDGGFEANDDSVDGGAELLPPSDSDGVIARAVYDLFQIRNSLPQGKDRVKVEMTYLEIYNEQAIDLLSNDPNSATLSVHDSKDGVVVKNLKSFVVSSPGDVQKKMELASQKRATGSTQMNSVSSRSHAICTLNVTITPLEEETVEEDDGSDGPTSSGEMIKAKLTLVDLAGSERIKKTGAEGARMKEGISINKGLFVLGQVVSALSEMGQQNGVIGGKKSNSHIPYRDSKLTRLLQDSLGGNSRTVMIACISPAESNIEESVNTLRYAERTRNIKNSAVRNVVSTGLSANEAAALRRENQQLKLELSKMESMIQSSNGNTMLLQHGGGMVGVRGLRGAENGAMVAKLQAQCYSLLAENDTLKERAKSHSNEVLEASLRADKWQAKSEHVIQIAKEHGVELPENPHGDGEGIVIQLRNELAECKSELLDARTEAAVARATAGAFMNGKEFTSVDDIVSSSAIESMTDEEGDDQNDHLTTELSAVDGIIEQKEAMVLQMNRERACRDNFQVHLENSLQLLQEEVETLTSERDQLVVQMSNPDETDNNNRRKRKTADNPQTKRLREQISRLEDRINDLNSKAREHTRSLKLKEEAEKKCAKLTAEIAQDKKRRADLQKKLKETSVEMRAEKKAAKQNASRLMKDSAKLKIELGKMKNVAEKQAAVLKRKIDEAAAKERARVEFEKKHKSADHMRHASSAATKDIEIKESRKNELDTWIDKEVNFTLIKFQIEEQKRQLESVMSDRRKLIKNNSDTVDVLELEQIDSDCQSLKDTIHDLEATAKKAFPTFDSSNLTWRFLDSDAFKSLSKYDAKYALSYVFDMYSSVKQELDTVSSEQVLAIKSAVHSAVAKEKQLHELELVKLKVSWYSVLYDIYTNKISLRDVSRTNLYF